MEITLFRNITELKPYYLPLAAALERIRTGKSAKQVQTIRDEPGEEKKQAMKKELPSVLFSGKFRGRKDSDLIAHSGVVILDFDDVMTLILKEELKQNEYIHACWISPGGNGLKALVKIADPLKHRQHLKSIFKTFPQADPVNINVARVCFESYDPDIYMNPDSKVWTEIVQTETVQIKNAPIASNETFTKLKKWLINSGIAFREGERNIYIFKLASACCRFGIDETLCINLIASEYLTNDSEFSKAEAIRTIRSAYKANETKRGTAVFENGKAIITETKTPIEPETFDETIKPRDVIYGMDVIEDALRIYDFGYEFAETTHIPMLDNCWKFKRGEITLLSGIGNFGKTSFLNQLLLIKTIKKNYKWAMFSPESFPAHEFYHDLTEMILGCNCAAYNQDKPSRQQYAAAYKKVSDNFFFTYPIEKLHTPDLIRQRFLELVIKEKVDGMVIDPFNQLSNDWGERDDKYLEKFLSESGKFARETNTFFFIINHPKQMHKNGALNYPCPDVYDLANGAMWNNKADNILVYHRPNYSQDPKNPACELHAKKIRRQKITGLPGMIEFEYNRDKRRYYFKGESPLEEKQIAIKNFYETETENELPYL